MSEPRSEELLLTQLESDYPAGTGEPVTLREITEEGVETLSDVETKGRKAYFELRNNWSKYLIRILTLMVIFQLVLTVAVGRDWVNFEKYPTFLGAIVVESFLQIAGMCYIVVRCLFPNENS